MSGLSPLKSAACDCGIILLSYDRDQICTERDVGRMASSSLPTNRCSLARGPSQQSVLCDQPEADAQ